MQGHVQKTWSWSALGPTQPHPWGQAESPSAKSGAAPLAKQDSTCACHRLAGVQKVSVAMHRSIETPLGQQWDHFDSGLR